MLSKVAPGRGNCKADIRAIDIVISSEARNLSLLVPEKAGSSSPALLGMTRSVKDSTK